MEVIAHRKKGAHIFFLNVNRNTLFFKNQTSKILDAPVRPMKMSGFWAHVRKKELHPGALFMISTIMADQQLHFCRFHL